MKNMTKTQKKMMEVGSCNMEKHQARLIKAAQGLVEQGLGRIEEKTNDYGYSWLKFYAKKNGGES